MTIDLSVLNIIFQKKPLLIGGKAMEYYGIRKAGKDVDLVASKEDLLQLLEKFPDKAKNLYGDFGVSVSGFEIWKTIRFMSYEELIEDAVEDDQVFVISLEKLMLQKALAMDIEKYRNDLKLIVSKYTEELSSRRDRIFKENEELIQSVPQTSFIEYKQ